ncbi:MAG: hypothetical protein VYC44_09895 [Chloroflexota bacterium]|jgi:hypothetical protein|nr:hypothetical protein [Chloroflexota bacterium]MEC8911281.1 hypothetical protein [Chloroflexota bacterium]MEC9272165.1 hypothetical protein [Chloroflexota bacterium]MEE3245874.1 hypothetical protein [Chloroflexota bacterium]MEE3249789.1 hypothetical protein [Chloroflexota bacterium]|tara:strand:- start:28 stop:975 length:948 start_codon:yes stop_codon:yes gene_type:complete
MVQAEIKTTFEVGPVTFIARHELWDGNIQDHADQGVSIVVQGEIDGEKTTLLRFNCFDVERSYVYGPQNPDLKDDGPMMLAGQTQGSTGMGKLYRMDPTTDGNPIGWTIKTMKNKLPDMLDRSGYPEIAKQIDLEELADVLPELEASARELFITKRNTVKHNRGTEIFEAGNIRFGLEMRRLPVGDGGLAIHVLTDIGGSNQSFVEETEIMAFDLFWDGPHYHYGPRNKNHRIYWDRTLVTDYFGWVKENIEGKKLGPMIERAGYPGIAADLDQDMIDAVLPAMSAKAREMLELGENLTGHPGLPEQVTPNLAAN